MKNYAFPLLLGVFGLGFWILLNVIFGPVL